MKKYNNARAACKQLGYGNAIKSPNKGAYREGNLHYLNVEFFCEGDSLLRDCRSIKHAKSCSKSFCTNLVCLPKGLLENILDYIPCNEINDIFIPKLQILKLMMVGSFLQNLPFIHIQEIYCYIQIKPGGELITESGI